MIHIGHLAKGFCFADKAWSTYQLYNGSRAKAEGHGKAVAMFDDSPIGIELHSFQAVRKKKYALYHADLRQRI